MNERMKIIALIGVLMITLLVLVGFMYGMIAQRDIELYAPTLVGFAVPVITTLLAAIGISSKLETIHGKVNGNYDTLRTENETMRLQLNQFLAVTDPDTASNILDTDGNEGRHRHDNQ